MQTKTKYKKLLFWELGILTLVVAALVVCIGLSGRELPAGPEETTGSRLTENPYGPESFTEVGGYLTAAGSVLGVDVSQWQGNIDWQQVKSAGVEFALLRIGGRGTGQKGTLYTDDFAQKNYAGATAAGIQVGGYFFSQAISPEEAVEEARFVLQQTQGWDIKMPIVFDWEYMDNARTSHITAQEIMAFAKAFCDEIALAGHTPMIYFNYRMIANGFDLEQMADYRFWLAMYDREMDFPYRVDMWQYTASGKVPGIGTNVDLNLYFPREEGE